MQLNEEEFIFYAAAWGCGTIGRLGRELLNGDFVGVRSFIGGVLSGGIFGFGVIGLWLGYSPSDGSNGFPLLGAASLVGWFSQEAYGFVQRSFSAIITAALKKIGFDIEQQSESNKDVDADRS